MTCMINFVVKRQKGRTFSIDAGVTGPYTLRERERESENTRMCVTVETVPLSFPAFLSPHCMQL